MVAQGFDGHGIPMSKEHLWICQTTVYAGLADDGEPLAQQLPRFDIQALGDAIERVERDVLVALLNAVQKGAADPDHHAKTSLREAHLLAKGAHVFAKCLSQRSIHTVSVDTNVPASVN